MSTNRSHPYESVRIMGNDIAALESSQPAKNIETEVSHRLKSLRLRCGLSIRKLAIKANVTAAMISCIERKTASPSIATMQKILDSLETDFASFFSTDEMQAEGPVYHREKMSSFSDEGRSYTFIFPKNDVDVKSHFSSFKLPLTKRQ